MNSEEKTQLLEISKALRNCRKIEHRIYQLQKQLYLGHTTAYNMSMRLIYPDYDKHRKLVKEKFGSTLENNEKLKSIGKEIEDGKSKPESKSEPAHKP